MAVRVDQIAQQIQADRLIFQNLDDLIHAVNCEHPELRTFETSVFNGDYITGDVDQSYLEHLAECRRDGKKKGYLQEHEEQQLTLFNDE